jgi:glycosyltransferase involved in cell wall biosynthesis
MHIGIDGLPLSETLTGIGYYTLELAKHLARSSPLDTIEVVSPRAFVSSENFHEIKSANLSFIRATVNPLTRHWWSIGLPRYIRKREIDLFHGTNFEVPLRRDCPTVLAIHDLSTLLYPQTHESKRVRRSRQRLPQMARAATMILTPTENVRKEVSEFLQISLEKIATIPYAARSCFRPLPSEETAVILRTLGIGGPFLLFVGTVEPRKNLLTLVRAFEEVLQRREQSLQLVIAGKKGWLFDDLFSYIKQSTASDRIVFAGYLSDEELCALYTACTIFVFPSLYEGFGLPPLEAMACGAPVIASRIPSITEVVGSAARLVEPESASELTAAILELLSFEVIKEELSTAGRKRAAEFSWALTVRATKNVYAEAIKRFNYQQQARPANDG